MEDGAGERWMKTAVKEVGGGGGGCKRNRDSLCGRKEIGQKKKT